MNTTVQAEAWAGDSSGRYGSVDGGGLRTDQPGRHRRTACVLDSPFGTPRASSRRWEVEVIGKESRGSACFRDGPKCFVRGTSVSVKERLWARSGFGQLTAKRSGCKGRRAVWGGGWQERCPWPGVEASQWCVCVCVWMCRVCRPEASSKSSLGLDVVVIDRTAEGGGRVKEARWRGRALWSRSGSLSDAGLAGSGRFCTGCIN